MKGRQLLVLFVLTVQNTALILTTKYSLRGGSAPYLSSTVVACSEVVKLCVSYVLLRFCDNKAAKLILQEVANNCFYLAVPAVLYVVQNNLLFEGMRFLSPALFTVCSQSKIFTSALFSVLLLRVKPCRRQVFSLILLACGMIIVQHGERAQRSEGVQRTRFSTTLYGIVIVFLASFASGFAGAYLERMYKAAHSEGRSVWYRNTQLALLSLPVAFLAMYVRDGERLLSRGILQGYNSVVILIILLQAIGGLLVAVVLQYATNLLKCFAISISICNCTVATVLMSENDDSSLWQVSFGILMVIASTFTYSLPIHSVLSPTIQQVPNNKYVKEVHAVPEDGTDAELDPRFSSIGKNS